MDVLSKLYESPINRLHCSQNFLHAGSTCWQFFLSNSYHYTKSTAVHFLPLLITPLVLKLKHLEPKVFLHALTNYLLTVICASSGSALIFLFICLMRNWVGYYQRFTFTLLPSLLGIQICWLYPKPIAGYFKFGTSQAVLESLLRLSTNPLSRLVLHSKSVQTLLFMINSAIILHYKRAHNYKGFWFIQPIALDVAPTDKTPNDGDETHPPACNVAHGGMTCRQFVLSGIKSCLYIGTALDFVNMLMKGKVPKNDPSILAICGAKLKALRLNTTAFFVCYSGIYRLSLCLLAKYQSNHSDALRHCAAALFGGLSYACMSRMTLYMYSVVLAIDILWLQFCKKRTEKSNRFSEILKKVPFSNLAIIVNMAYLVHAFLFHYESVNGLGRGFLNAVTNKRIQAIHDYCVNTNFETSLGEASRYTAKGFFR